MMMRIISMLKAWTHKKFKLHRWKYHTIENYSHPGIVYKRVIRECTKCGERQKMVVFNNKSVWIKI